MRKADIDNRIWECAKREMKLAIIERAKKRIMINYSELLNKITLLKLDMEQVDHRNIMAEMLGEISLVEDKAGRGMLSALVTHKTGDMEPGQGFFQYAESLGKDISDKTKFWAQEVNKIHKYWSEH
ncbi:MAG: hypothetical protein Q8O22_00720 [Candidatus Omnitrophota bacterium]|nr:hypothetical protein [Candidatus Omnitrophota bacterium]